MSSSTMRIYQVFSVANPKEVLTIRGLATKESEMIISNVIKSPEWIAANYGATDRRTTIPFMPEKPMTEAQLLSHFQPLINNTVRVFSAEANKNIYSPVVSIDVTPNTVSKSKAGGTTQQFAATILPAYADQTVLWEILNPAAGVSINASGLVTIASDATNGNYSIKGTSKANTGKTETVTLTVTA